MNLAAASAVHVVITIAIVGASVAISAGAAVWLLRRLDPGLYARRPGMSRWASFRQNRQDRLENPPTYLRVLYPLIGVWFTVWAGTRRGWPMAVVAAIAILPFFLALGLWVGPLTRWSRDHPIPCASLLAPADFVLVATAFTGLSLWWCALGGLVIAVVSAAVGLRQRPRPNLSGSV